MKKTRLALMLAVSLIALGTFGSVYSAAPSAADLISSVNALRANNSLAPISTNSALMAAAQAHADYLASTYDTNYPTWDEGHIGAGGTYARDRAIAAGFPLESGMNVTENWAGGNSQTTISNVIYSYWADETHMATMLHPDAVAVGAGISEGASGSVYFILDVAVRYGSGGSGGGVASTIPTTAVTAQVALVKVAAPAEDGSVIHVVDSGQALWNIAAAYDVSVDQIKLWNNLSSDIISVGQELLVQLAYTATPTLTATNTPRPATSTPIPPRTVQPGEAQPEESEVDSGGGFLGLDRQSMGLALILICGAGLALVVIGSISKDKQKPPSE